MSYYRTPEMAKEDELKYEQRYQKLRDILKPFIGKSFDEVGKEMQRALSVFMQSCDTPPVPMNGSFRQPYTELSPWIAFVSKDEATGLCLWKYSKRY